MAKEKELPPHALRRPPISNDSTVSRMQRGYFGRGFEGVTLSSVSLGRELNEKLLAWLKADAGMLVIFGSPGCGKTHTCAAIFDFWVRKNPYVTYLPERAFFGKLRSITNGDYYYEIKQICSEKYVIYDDLATSVTDWRTDVIGQLVEDRFDSGAPTVVTTNMLRNNIAHDLSPRIASRLLSKRNCILDLSNHPDWRE